MSPIILTPELREAVKRIIWFEPPEQAVRNTARFMAYAFRYGMADDMRLLRNTLGDDDLHRALANAPPGIIDERSWSYWHALLGKFPPPPMPQRRFD